MKSDRTLISGLLLSLIIVFIVMSYTYVCFKIGYEVGDSTNKFLQEQNCLYQKYLTEHLGESKAMGIEAEMEKSIIENLK